MPIAAGRTVTTRHGLRLIAAPADATAKAIEYPTGHLHLAGPAWSWRPTALLALTSAAAIGAGFLPAAAAHRSRP